jgi:hypothetical protein
LTSVTCNVVNPSCVATVEVAVVHEVVHEVRETFVGGIDGGVGVVGVKPPFP